jgi:acetyl-CoA carboxylase biotin carboxyl carrier protein
MADVTAHINGTIFKIEIEIGSKVTAGEEIIILESMKMEIPIEAPVDGIVKEILIKEGQAVEEGDVVAVIAAD